MTYKDIHRAVVGTIRSVTGRKAISLENDKEKSRGCFKLIEDSIRSERVTLAGYETSISYILGYFPTSEAEYREECIAFLENVQRELLCRGITVPNMAHLNVNEVSSDIDTEFPALIMTFNVSAHFKYIINSFDENNENMEELKGEITHADIT